MGQEVVRGATDGACEEQLVAVEDGLNRLGDPYLWEEVDKLARLHALGRRGPDDLDDVCSRGTRDALVAVAVRWAEQGAEGGGVRSYGLAKQAFDALKRGFPNAAEAPRVRLALGRLEWARAERTSVEVGERTLADDGYRAAREHLQIALAGELTAEERATAARLNLEAMRRIYDDAPPGWDMAKETCIPDARGRCAKRPPPVPESGADREWLAACEAYLAAPTLREGPDGARVATLRAVLLMRLRRWEEAEAALRGLAAQRVPEARRLLVGVLLARWMEGEGAAAQAGRRALIEAASEIGADGGEAGSLATSLRRSALWAEAGEAEAAGEQERCGAAFATLHAESAESAAEAVEAADGASRCFEAAGDTAQAIAWLSRLADQHRGDARASGATLRLARLHAQILDDGPALARYLDFLARAPKGGGRTVVEARGEALRLAIRVENLPEAQLEGLVRDAVPAERRAIAAGIRFRSALRPGAGLAAALGYIERFGKDGGVQRLVIAHAQAAMLLMQASCPVDDAPGVCAQVGRDKMIGRIVPRDPKLLAQAREHLTQATAILPAALDAGREQLEAALRIKAEEVRAASRLAALLQGDLDAELVLATRPPASLDPARSRVWLTIRSREVERMSKVYEAAGAEGRDAAAAVVEARKALVYESDLVQLEGVAAAVAAAGDAQLAGEMLALAAERREAVFVAYTRCVELVAGWGLDPSGQGAGCRAGLGRLVGRYDEPLEYVPDARGRVVVR